MDPNSNARPRSRRRRAALAALAVSLAGPASAAPPAPAPARAAAPALPAAATASPSPSPSEIVAATAAPVLPAARGEYPIDLNTALRLAEAENPTIAEARTAITAALARQQQAYALLLPTFNAGTNYHGHVGNLQRSSGRILNLSEQSLYFGGGARTLAAESLAIPAVNIFSPLTDAIFEPLAARQRVAAARSDAQATANATLLEVAVLHLDLLAAQAVYDMQQLSLSQTAEVVRVTRAYANAGEGREADAERSATEYALRKAEVQAAEGEVAVASARLARRLNLDPSVRLRPAVAAVEPLPIVALDVPTPELIAVAIRRRPEVRARTARIGEADAVVRRETHRPLLPTVWVGFSGGAFGGGSNLISNGFNQFAGRTDFDVRVFWTLQNMGAGNIAQIRRRRAEEGQAVADRSVAINLVRQEVTSAQANARAAFRQIDLTRAELKSAEAGFAEDLDRARQNLGKPIEVLNNLNYLAEARVNVIRAITRYNQEQFRLFVALGSPPPLSAVETPPAGPPPVTTPIHAPFRVSTF